MSVFRRFLALTSMVCALESADATAASRSQPHVWRTADVEAKLEKALKCKVKRDPPSEECVVGVDDSTNVWLSTDSTGREIREVEVVSLSPTYLSPREQALEERDAVVVLSVFFPNQDRARTWLSSAFRSVSRTGKPTATSLDGQRVSLFRIQPGDREVYYLDLTFPNVPQDLKDLSR
jgi:hypothetical protein